MNENRITLEELAQKPYPIIFDTNIILYRFSERSISDFKKEVFYLPITEYVKKVKIENIIKEKIITAEKDRDFFILLENYIKKGCNFYITPEVVNELQGGRGYPPKKIKKISRDFPIHREILELYRERIKENKEKSHLVNVFEDNDRIFCLKENEQNLFRHFYKKYFCLLENCELIDNHFTDNDFKILIYCMSRAKKSGPTALISNDRGIHKAAKIILKGEDICYKAELFIRRNFFYFEKVDVCY